MTIAPTEAACQSLRERKKWITRGELRRSALALVRSRGLAAVTVEDIAADAGVSPRTFFNYFASKEDAVSGWDPMLVADLVERLRARPSGEAPAAALRAALLDVLPPVDADRQELLERLQLVRSDPGLLSHQVGRWAEAERQLVTVLAERRGTDAATDHYAALVVATTLAAGRIALQSWCDKEGAVPLAEELASHFAVLASGLRELGRRAR